MIRRWDPWRDMDHLQREINNLFTERPSARRRTAEEEAAWTPLVDTYEDAEGFEIHVDLPGVAQEDLKIGIEEDVLTISGTRRLEDPDKRENYQRIERIYGAFRRSFSLPPTVDVDRIEANLKEGILKLRLPKREETKPRQVEIQVK